MGQKVNPNGFRVGVIKDWNTRWYASKKDFADFLVEDRKIRDFVKKKYYQASISRIEIDRAAGILDHDGLEAGASGILRRPAHAEIGGEAGDHDLGDATLAQIAFQPRPRPAIGLDEAGIAVDAPAKTLADHRFGMRQVEPGMEGGPGRPLHAMIRPEHLRAIIQLDRLEGLAAGVAGGEGGVSRRVPVLRQHDMAEAAPERVDCGYDRVAIRHGEAPARTEIVLDVDDEQDGPVVGHRLSSYCSLTSTTPGAARTALAIC